MIQKLLEGYLTPTTAAPKLATATLPDPIPDIDGEDDEEEVAVNMDLGQKSTLTNRPS